MLVGCFHHDAYSSDLIVAVLIVLYFLYCQGNRCNLLSEGWNTNFGSDNITSISAGDLGTITMRRAIAMRGTMRGTMGVHLGVSIDHRQTKQRQNECLEMKLESYFRKKPRGFTELEKIQTEKKVTFTFTFLRLSIHLFWIP
jgi:hypothetical protein